MTRPFLNDYRSLGRQAPRIERVLAVGRAFLAVSGLVAIYLDPTEPARFARLTYAMLSAYALYSIVVLAVVQRVGHSGPRLGQVLHGVDILWASALTFFSEGPVSPFFLFFLFVLLAAAYRWAFRETIATAAITVAIFLLETLVAAVSPWNHTWFADISFELNPIIIRSTYLLLTGFLLAYLAEQEKQFRAEMALTTEAMHQPRVSLGLGGSVAAIARLLLRVFQATAVDVVIQDQENARTLLWHAKSSEKDIDQVPVRRLELDDRHRTAWFFESPSRTWCAVSSHQEDPLRALAVDSDKWAVRSARVSLPAVFTDARDFNTVAAVDFGLAGEWRGRLLLYDPAQLEHAPARLHFLESLADHITPVLSNVFLLRRLRSRVGAAERARVAREIHDGAIQALIGIEMEAEALRRRAERETPEVVGDLTHIQELLRQEVIALRELMQELRPVDLDSPHQLPDVMAGLVERFRRETGVSARFTSNANTATLPLRTALEIVRIMQEALVNVRKHSRARTVLVRLLEQDGGWMLSVEDDGRGFEFEGRLTEAELNNRLIGPAIIKERTRIIGGHVSVESSPGAGSRVEVTFNAARTH